MSPMAALLCLGDLEGEKEASAGGAKVEEVDQLAKRQEGAEYSKRNSKCLFTMYLFTV